MHLLLKRRCWDWNMSSLPPPTTALGRHCTRRETTMHRKSLALQKKVLGVDHVDASLSYTCIGFTLAAKGDYDGAIKVTRMALVFWLKVKGTNHERTATFYCNIAISLRKKGDYEAALVEH